MQIRFQSLEYTKDDDFEKAEYEFIGDTQDGWVIHRNGSFYLKLGPGYELLKSKFCGVCSTDLDRRFLPFPLPQIIGHEVVAESPDGKNKYVVEINDTDFARGNLELDVFSVSGIHTHSPDRMVLGIDRLPGGFGEYVLVPQNSKVSFSKISDRTAVLVEPFAAALQAVTSSPPKKGDRVAVLGPRRLGSLLLSALLAFRRSSSIDFQIISLVRHDHLILLSKKLGADEVIDLRRVSLETLSSLFDMVYDTTSAPSGFEAALRLAKREVHLKSTNGQEVLGLKKLTEFVVDELALLPFSEENLDFKWEGEVRENRLVYISSNVDIGRLPDRFKEFRMSKENAMDILKSKEFAGRLPRFDIAIASSVREIDDIIRPYIHNENSLLRPRGAILFQGDVGGNLLLDFLTNGKNLRASRCGDFHLAVRLLESNPEIAENLSDNMISHVFDSGDMKNAFLAARDPNSIKVIIEHK